MPQRRPASTPAFPHIAAASAVEVQLAAEGKPAARLQLLPLGEVQLRDGRGPFTVADAQAVIDATRAHAGRTQIVVDYDHQHFFGVKPGVAAQAPAAGWIDPASLTAEADGIWGTVEWTAAAAEKLKAREYRYISPLFAFDEKTRAVLAILNASLTNVPAIEALAAAAGREWAANSRSAAAAELEPDPNTTQETDKMLLAKIAAALGLADSATEDEVMAKLAALNEGAAGVATATAAIAAAATQLGLKADATATEVAAAALAKAPDPKAFVPIAAFDALQAQVTALQADKVAATVEAAMEEGKVPPALKDWALAYATKDAAGFADWLAKAPVIVAPGAQLAAAAAQAGADGLTEQERQVARMLGRTPEQMLKAKKEA